MAIAAAIAMGTMRLRRDASGTTSAGLWSVPGAEGSAGAGSVVTPAIRSSPSFPSMRVALVDAEAVSVSLPVPPRNRVPPSL